MTQLEKNRQRRSDGFFKSDDLDENLQKLYACWDNNRVNYYPNNHPNNYKQCLLNWKQNPTENVLDLSLLFRYGENFPPLDTIPRDVHTLVIFDIINTIVIPPILSKRKKLLSLQVHASTIPVMPYIQIFNWLIADSFSVKNNGSGPVYDFSEWSNLRILTLNGISPNSHIILPHQLISLTLNYSKCYNRIDDSPRPVQEVFGNITTFQSLKHVHINEAPWSDVPKLYCKYFFMMNCNHITTLEVPKCISFRALSCQKFSGFGRLTLLHNKVLDIIQLSRLGNENTLYHLPPGAPTGYRHIDISCTKLAALPTRFDPYVYISLIGTGPRLFINDPKARDNFEFYFDQEKFTSYDQTISDQCLPRPGETLRNMIDRVYGFNWPKLITKIQRQIRFKQYIKNTYKRLIKYETSKEVCNYEIAKYMGASNTFKNKNYINC